MNYNKSYSSYQELKPPCSYLELIDKLCSRGMSISDKEKAQHFLQYVSYYRFSGYALAFEVTSPASEKRSHSFKSGTSFNDVINLYKVDSLIRSLIMQAIEQIEVAVRSLINHNMACKYNDTHWYLNSDHFAISNYFSHTDLLKSIEDEIIPKGNNSKGRKREVFILHYLNSYKNPMLPACWMIAEILTLGKWSNIYTNLKKSTDKKLISKCFDLSPDIFQSWLHALTYLRNLCAHHARLCHRQFIITPAQGKIKINFNKQLHDYLLFINYFLNIINGNENWLVQVENIISQLPKEHRVFYGYKSII